MIEQTLALLWDAYRDLNARKLFWVTLILSAAVVGAFALVGVDDKGLSIVTAHIQTPQASVWYKVIFRQFVIGFWLTWAAAILALISTAGIFADFISGGSIDLYLSKPISRPRLFATKYAAGLLFVTVQVLVVTGGSFVAMGLRGREWNPRLFWAVPIVLCFFSYLFAICVLLGVLTRSAIAALLLTILCWGLLALMDRTEPSLLTLRNMYDAQATEARRQADLDDANLRRAELDPKSASLLPELRREAESRRRTAEENEHTASVWRNVHRAVYAVKTVTPKTTDTINLLDRCIFSTQEAESAVNLNGGGGARRPAPSTQEAETVERTRQTLHEIWSRSPGWVIGTSLSFEAVLIAWAGWVFSRRDY